MMIKFNSLIPELYVRNIGSSIAFYNKLGFKILYQREAEKFAFLEYEGSQLMLEELQEDSWITGSIELPLGRGINFQIRVNDINYFYEKSRQNKIPIYKSIYEKWYRVNEFLYGNKQFLIQDLDGYLLRFYQDLGCKQD